MLFPRYYRDVHILHSAPVAQSVEQIERTQPVVVMVRGVARGQYLNLIGCSAHGVFKSLCSWRSCQNRRQEERVTGEDIENDQITPHNKLNKTFMHMYGILNGSLRFSDSV